MSYNNEECSMKYKMRLQISAIFGNNWAKSFLVYAAALIKQCWI